MITNPTLLRALAIAVLGIGVIVAPMPVLAQSTRNSSAPNLIKEAVGCLVTADFVREALQSLDLKVGDFAHVRFRIGSIKGTSPARSLVNVVVYADDEHRAWLLLVDHDGNGGFIVIRNGYRLTRKGDNWQADEGNGGLATYAAVSRFAAVLFRGPKYTILLTPVKVNCSVE